MVTCDYCGTDTYMPFRCNYCGGYFCAEHRLPENHDCKGTYQYSRHSSSTVFTPTGASYSPLKTRPSFWFSRVEIRDLAIGLMVIMGIFLIEIWRMIYTNPLILFSITLIIALAFILHELAHKFAAQKSGYWAEFRLNQQGLILTLFSFISPFKIIAPGAVMIRGGVSWDDYGKISAVGPATNVLLGFISLLGFILSRSSIVAQVFFIGMRINSSIALFNLIPFGVFDGAKILKWDWRIWGFLIIAAAVIYFSPF